MQKTWVDLFRAAVGALPKFSLSLSLSFALFLNPSTTHFYNCSALLCGRSLRHRLVEPFVTSPKRPF